MTHDGTETPAHSGQNRAGPGRPRRTRDERQRQPGQLTRGPRPPSAAALQACVCCDAAESLHCCQPPRLQAATRPCGRRPGPQSRRHLARCGPSTYLRPGVLSFGPLPPETAHCGPGTTGAPRRTAAETRAAGGTGRLHPRGGFPVPAVQVTGSVATQWLQKPRVN